MRYRALLAYEGTAYQGFQWQPGAPTVQGEVERALMEVTQQRVRLLAAGRTDAGVHAMGQVIAFDVMWRHETIDLHQALNARLPADIVVRRLEPAPSDFHPRYDAQSRIYRYTILNQPWPDPLLRRVTYHLRRPLDVVAMNQATQMLVGLHDFAAFGQPTRDGGPTVRRVLAARCWREDSLVHFEIEANAFLRRMVRRLMGVLLCVGRKRRPVADPAAMLSAEAGSTAGPAVPPHGLCLRRVVYEWQWGEYGKAGGGVVGVKTYAVKSEEIQREWWVVDARGKNLGRLASGIARILRGKHKPIYSPHLDTGDHVIVTNAGQVAVTGRKLDQKVYYRHSGYPGSLRSVTLRQQLERHPTRVLRAAVRGMLPKNRLGRKMLGKLRIYPGAEHPHQAQQPKPLEL